MGSKEEKEEQDLASENEKDTKKNEKNLKNENEDKSSKDEKESKKVDIKVELEEQIKSLNDKLLRQMAEFENFRKRSEKEKAFSYEIGEKAVISKLLPVIDNFERGLKGVEKDEKENEEDGFVSGMVMTYTQMMKTLEELGVKPIEAIEKEFDPTFHEAIMHIEDEKDERTNVIVEEFQKGYMFGDTVLRHSIVKVLN